MNINKNLSSIFELETVERSLPMKVELPASDNAVAEDFSIVRQNLHDLLETGQDALLDALEIAKSSENPRAFEVVGNLMKQLSDINKQLLDIHTQKKTTEPEAKKNVTNNSIFVGSTTELNKLINQMNTEV